MYMYYTVLLFLLYAWLYETPTSCLNKQTKLVNYPSFTEVEHTIEEAQDELTTYYRSNSLRVNPGKTQVTSFHLKNREAKRMLEDKWNNTDLENTPHPK